MRQILLHPGFHKTGTSSIQHFLWINREVQAPHFDLRMFRHMKPVVRLAALFSRTGNPLDLVDMVGLLDDVFGEFPVNNDRDLLISCEGLAGHLPVMYLPMPDALRHPLGPGAALVDQMNVPANVRANLTAVGRGNAGPDDDLWEQFLTLNRSTLPDRDVAARKKALAEASALGGWKTV